MLKMGSLKNSKAFRVVNKWLLLYLVLALLLLFSIFAVPKIAVGAMSETKGNIVTVETESPY